jgi:hypothetical protein
MLAFNPPTSVPPESAPRTFAPFPDDVRGNRAVTLPPTTPPGEFLSRAELRELTSRARRADQLIVLKRLGLPHRCAEPGLRVLVSRQHVRDWLNGSKVIAPRAPSLEGIK